MIMKTKNLRKEFELHAKQTGSLWSIIEKYYILSWVLWGIVQIDKLKNHLVFEGGTALKKCYFGDYRFSEDLDFSVQGDYPRGEELLLLLREACKKSGNHLKSVGHNIDIICTRYTEKQPHPDNQDAFTVQARLPWHNVPSARVMIEITTKETILLPPNTKSIIHGYNEELTAQINVYSLEEIVAEKVRALLQFAKKLHERGWCRSRVRDYYDIWSILTQYGKEMDCSILPDLTDKKCAAKGIEFKSFEDILHKILRKMLSKNGISGWATSR